MCTLIVLHRCVPGRPLVVAANRDEFYARPAEGPAIRRAGAGRILAPLDLEAGGTWLGLNDRGVFAGLTNLRPWRPGLAEPSQGDALATSTVGLEMRSRGEIVMRALEAETAEVAARWFEGLEERAYNPFQLVVADAHSAWQLVHGERFRLFALEPGPHVVGNVEDPNGPPGATLAGGMERAERAGEDRSRSGAGEVADFESLEPRARKLDRVRARVDKLLTGSDGDLLEGLGEICREHVDFDGPRRGDARRATNRATEREPIVAVADGDSNNAERAFASTCVHVAERYGTRSSLLLELARDREASRLWASAGPPCEAPYEDLSPLLRELDVRSGARSAAEPQARTNG